MMEAHLQSLDDIDALEAVTASDLQRLAEVRRVAANINLRKLLEMFCYEIVQNHDTDPEKHRPCRMMTQSFIRTRTMGRLASTMMARRSFS